MILPTKKIVLQYLIVIFSNYKTRHISGRWHLIQTKLNKQKKLDFEERLVRVHIHVYLSNANIKITYALKLLGLLLDKKMLFNENANNKINKETKKKTALFRKLQSILLHRSLFIIFKFSIRPHLDYGDVIHDQMTNA